MHVFILLVVKKKRLVSGLGESSYFSNRVVSEPHSNKNPYSWKPNKGFRDPGNLKVDDIMSDENLASETD